jgi:N-acetyl-beta-hexosaminidase
MSASKMNVLHWHIIDAPSFPLHLRSAPQLARHGAYSPLDTYSEKDIARVVAYAAARGVRVLPEIDMPGHAYSWGQGAPQAIVCSGAQPWEEFCGEPPCGQLDPTLPETYALVDAVIKDVADLFADAFIHLGADEVNYRCWQLSSALVQRMRAAGSESSSGSGRGEDFRHLWQVFAKSHALALVVDKGKIFRLFRMPLVICGRSLKTTS